MQKWDYKVVAGLLDIKLGKIGFSSYLDDIEYTSIQNLCSAFGKNGWELVSTTPYTPSEVDGFISPDCVIYFIFKKPLLKEEMDSEEKDIRNTEDDEQEFLDSFQIV